MKLTSDCSFPHCRRAAHPRMDMPICSHHAQAVYLRVKDLLDAGAPRPIEPPPPKIRATPRQKVREQGLIYFARIGGRIKIGYTTSLRQRMQSLRADEVLCTVPGTREDEAAMHVRFRDYWLGGEFFEPAQELLDWARGQAA